MSIPPAIRAIADSGHVAAASLAFESHFRTRPNIARRAPDITFTSDGCWLWPTASYIKVGPRGRRRYVHRISLEIKLGRPLGEQHALHSCDRPPCCNPAHLRPGDARENARDMVERGRARNKVVYGIENNKATLTDEQVVRALCELAAGETMTSVARRWGVTRRAVHTWREGTARRVAHEAWVQICEGSSSGNDGRPFPLRRWVG